MRISRKKFRTFFEIFVSRPGVLLYTDIHVLEHTGLCKFLGNVYGEYLKFGDTHKPKTWRSVLYTYLL